MADLPDYETIIDRARRFNRNRCRAAYYLVDRSGTSIYVLEYFCRSCADNAAAAYQGKYGKECLALIIESNDHYDSEPHCCTCGVWLDGFLTYTGMRKLLDHYMTTTEKINLSRFEDCYRVFLMLNETVEGDRFWKRIMRVAGYLLLEPEGAE